jgi:glycerophosphoryl diester phosphodiesterase
VSLPPAPRPPFGREPTVPPRSGTRLPRRPPAQAVLVPIVGLSVVAVMGIPFHSGGPDQSSGPAGTDVGLAGITSSGFMGIVDDLSSRKGGPMIIVRPGSGTGAGEDPGPPVPNTVTEVRRGYEAGIPVAEVDLQMTADGEVVVWQKDALPDLTCIITLTRDELVERVPDMFGFPAVLEATQRFRRTSIVGAQGFLALNLLPASPRCDPADTPARDQALVDAVVSNVRESGATDLVYFGSTSPVLLGLAGEAAPEIPRQLTVGFLQFLGPSQVEAAMGLHVTSIRKAGPDRGLRWWEVGDLHRLPAYRSPLEALETAEATGSSIIGFDLSLLEHLERAIPGAGVSLVATAQEMGFVVLAGQVSRPADWYLGVGLGVDGLYADDLTLAQSLRAPMD